MGCPWYRMNEFEVWWYNLVQLLESELQRENGKRKNTQPSVFYGAFFFFLLPTCWPCLPSVRAAGAANLAPMVE